MEERILVVDDDHDTANTMAKLIQTMGFEAKPVYDGLHAVEEVIAYAPDMALIDISMPEHDGYETVERIRRLPEGMHMILVALTGWARDIDKRRAYEAGFDLHITKPMQAATLQELLRLIDPAEARPEHLLLVARASPAKEAPCADPSRV
jgi:CheY-like chemotaxis protein